MKYLGSVISSLILPGIAVSTALAAPPSQDSPNQFVPFDQATPTLFSTVADTILDQPSNIWLVGAILMLLGLTINEKIIEKRRVRGPQKVTWLTPEELNQ